MRHDKDHDANYRPFSAYDCACVRNKNLLPLTGVVLCYAFCCLNRLFIFISLIQDKFLYD